MVKVLGVASNNGGVLKTTLITNLAGILSKTKRVLIVDTSAQGDCLLTFGKNPDENELTLYDVLVDNRPAEKAIQNVYHNIDILPSNRDMNLLEFVVLQNLYKYPQPFQLLKSALTSVIYNYDVILVDTPKNNGLAKGNAFSFVDHLIVPFQTSPFAIHALRDLTKDVAEFKRHQNYRLSILGVVVTMFDHQGKIEANTIEACREYCTKTGLHLFDSIIPRSIQSAQSVAFEGLPLTLTRKKHPEVVHYHELLRDIEENMLRAEEEQNNDAEVVL